MSPQSDPRIQYRKRSPYDTVVETSAEECLERSRRLLLETSSMVDPRKNGSPLWRSKTPVARYGPSGSETIRPGLPPSADLGRAIWLYQRKPAAITESAAPVGPDK